MLEQFRIADFVEWSSTKSLILNPDFQRGSVWTPVARIMLIDTILRGLPIPKIFIRSKIDTQTKRSIREIVDGQQRLRAIIDFANDKITLSKRAKEFSGYKFSTLTPELQEQFLTYPLAVDQLINADDATVLDIFARLNSYNVKLNAPELRHAAYQGDFKNSVHESALALFEFWQSFDIFSNREMVRLENDSFVSELYAVLLQGVSDGGAEKIDKIYKIYDPDGNFPKEDIEYKFFDTIEFIRDEIAPRAKQSVILKPPHLLLLFAAIAHVRHGIPQGGLTQLPARKPMGPDLNIVADNLIELGEIIGSKEEPGNFKEFWRASRSSTQRIASRKERFETYYNAVT